MALPLLYAGIPRQECKQTALEALTLVGLEQHVEHRPHQLSGDLQQRVASARALVKNAAMILADEPTGDLDSRVGMEIMKIFQESNRLCQVTIMIVTHAPHIAAYCQRRLSLHDGKTVSHEIE